MLGLLNRPQRKPLSCFKTWIFVVNKLKPTFVTETDGRFVFSECKGVERASIFRESNSNNYLVLVGLIFDSKDFRENGGHLWLSYVQLLRRDAYCTEILRGFTVSAFGNVTVKTPSSILALTFVVSIDGSSS